MFEAIKSLKLPFLISHYHRKSEKLFPEPVEHQSRFPGTCHRVFPEGLLYFEPSSVFIAFFVRLSTKHRVLCESNVRVSVEYLPRLGRRTR
jgi:hypothetical protein